jgi:hypothetical protein
MCGRLSTLISMMSGGLSTRLMPSFPSISCTLHRGRRLTGDGERIWVRWTVRFGVGLKVKEQSDHVVVDAEDALIAALKPKIERPDAEITYVRHANKRGDVRHPPHTLKKG